MRRWMCLLLAVCLTALCAGCAGGADVSDPVSSPPAANTVSRGGPQNFSVAYSREDTLNPFTAATDVNLSLAGLLYDSLTVMDAHFTPQCSLAEEIQRRDATHLAVTLRRNAVFSDGSAVQPSDVVASFQQAKASANYRALLANVTAAAADKKTGQIVFTLASADRNAEACLSFPIVKASTLTNEAGAAPVGGGLYVLSSTEDGVYLEANARFSQVPRYATVGLRHLPNPDAMYYGLTSGNITYYYNDLSSGELPRVTGAGVPVDMNALVFMGVNSGSEALGNASVRQALSLLIDRKTLAEFSFSGWAKPATTPFHPSRSEAEGLTGWTDTRHLVEALQLLEQAGYKTAAGRTKTPLELIYSNEGSFRAAAVKEVCSQLENAGIPVTATPLSYEEYIRRLSAGRYDLYIGEVRLSANMSLSALFPGGAAGYGTAAGSPALAAYKRCLAGEISLQEFIDAFAADMPFVPLCWRCGLAAYDRRLARVTPHGYNPYYGFASWQ